MKQILRISFMLIISYLTISNCFAQLREGFAQMRVAEDLDPTAMTMAPDGRIFITEKNGTIRIVRDGQLLPDPFLMLPVDNFNERGLGGIALDPDFEKNHHFYLFYTVPNKNRNRISRFTANGDYAIPGSEHIVLELDTLSGTIHNGGAMAFGPDGKLYISIGDGANSSNAQNLHSLLGKILRINADGSIPEDNPFYDQTTGIYRAIWALGLRNSFTFSFQPGTGKLFANDVGHGDFEEVNHIIKGGNYGWDKIEGPINIQTPPDNYQEPFYAYSHAKGCCIIGSAFYDPAIATFPPAYKSKYFFADYCAGWMHVLDPETGEIDSNFMTNLNQLVQILVAPEGDLYYLMRAGIGGGSIADNTSTKDGSLWRVFYEGSGAPFIAVQPQSVTVPIGEDAIFRVQASGKAPLIYQWWINDSIVATTDSAVYIIQNAQLTDDGKLIKCVVKNAQGEVSSTIATLHVTPNARPSVTISSPTLNTSYRAGATVQFAGHAADPEDGTLDAENLTWRIDFHHDDHIHPALDPTSGIASGTFSIPQIGEIDDNVFYRIHLTATDKGGLTNSTHRDILPEKTNFTVTTEPVGLPLSVDGKIVTTPFTVSSVAGIRRTISVPSSQLRDGKLYFFKAWDNGTTNDFYTFLAGEQSTIKARFESVPVSIGNGTGLAVNYYQFPATMRPDSAFTLTPKLARVDSIINFNWIFDSPDKALAPDYFAARWVGKIMPPLTGTYTFMTITDDGVRLWVDNKLLIDKWVPQPETAYTATIYLEAGKLYPIKMDYFEAGGHAVARLLWSTNYVPLQPIPTLQLFPDRLPKIPPGAQYDIRLTPNPASNVIYVEIDAKFSETITWQMIDVQGKIIAQGGGNIVAGANVFELPLANIATGAYFVKITGKNRIKETKPFIKH